MIRSKSLALVAGAVVLFAAEARAAEKVKVGVVPYAPLYDSIPRATGERIAETLRGELGSNEAIEVVALPEEAAAGADAGPKKGATDAQVKAVEGAKADLQKGKDLLKKKKVKPASDAFDRAIAAYEKNPEAVLDTAPLVEAYLKKAVTLYMLGREDEAAKKQIPAAVRLKPDLALVAGEEYAPVFVTEVEKTKKRLAGEGIGALRVDTTPPGAQVMVDDREAATSPVLVKGLFPGTHYVKIKPPGGEWYAQKIEVKADDTARITPDVVAKKEGMVAGLVTSLSKNQLDDGAKKQVKAIAEKSGAAYLVVGGAFAKGANMEIATLVYSTKKDAFSELQRLTLDKDMLGATIEINKLAGEVGFKVETFGDAAKLPRPFAADAKPGEEKINEVDFAAAALAAKSGAAGGAAAAGAVEGGDRTPVKPAGGRSRRPIVGGGARPDEDAGPGASAEEPKKPAAVAIGPKASKRPATKVDESGLVFREKTKPSDDFAAKNADAAADDEKKRKYMIGGSIDDERAFDDDKNKNEGGIFSKWWFWAGAGVLAAGGVAAGVMASDGGDTNNANGTVTW